jgi:signal peptidase I
MGLWVLCVYSTNSLDLSWLPSPRTLLGLVALGLFLIVRVGLNTWFHKYTGWFRQDRLLRREAEAAVRLAKLHLRGHIVATARSTSGEADDPMIREACADLERALRRGTPSRVVSCLDCLLFMLGSPKQLPTKGSVREFLESIAFAVLLTQLVHALVLELVAIPSGSMLPTLQFGDRIVVNRLRYGLRLPGTNRRWLVKQRHPERGDVVSFVLRQTPKRKQISRIIALSGDTVHRCGGQVLVNHQPLARQEVSESCEYDDYESELPHAALRHQRCIAYRERSGKQSYLTISKLPEGVARPACSKEQRVPDGQVFVIGDYRDTVSFLGLVPESAIEGKVWLIFWSAGDKTSVRWERMFERVHQ